LIAELEEKSNPKQEPPGESRPEPTSNQTEEIAAIVHELRQPMSSIIGYTDFLLSETIGILGVMQRKFLERVQMSTERMNRLVDDLARLTDSQMEEAVQGANSVVSLGQIAQEAAEQIKPLIQSRLVQLRLELGPELPDLALDRRTLGQVLANLLENAGEVTPEGGEITLRARMEGNEQQERYALVQVADQGGGIPAEYIPRLFSRYAGLDGKPIPGVASQTSLLSVTKALVDNLGGRIWVDSVAAMGSTYSLLLPVAPSLNPGDLTAEGLRA
jgi:signal transduction histidine kinase